MCIRDRAITSLRLSPQGASIAVAGTQQFLVEALYTDGVIKDVTSTATYAAVDIAPASGVASVSVSGLATGLSRGRTTVAVTYGGQRTDTVLSVGIPRGVCSVDGWCWRSPLPQGNYLPSIWGSDANNIWAVSDNGVVIKWDGIAWTPQSTPTTKNLLAVWGTDSKNVWAVGLSGTILKWDGKVWTAQLSGTTVSLSGVWGTDANNVWAVGDGGGTLALPPASGPFTPLYAAIDPAEHVSFATRVALLREIDAFARDLDPRLVQVSASISTSVQEIATLRRDHLRLPGARQFDAEQLAPGGLGWRRRKEGVGQPDGQQPLQHAPFTCQLAVVIVGPGAACRRARRPVAVSYTHLRAHETVLDLVCRLLLAKKKHTHHTT